MTAPRLRPLTARDLETLREIEAANWCNRSWRNGFVRVMDFGGMNASHHAKTAQKLVRHGLVEPSRTHKIPGYANARPGILYRCTDAGRALIGKEDRKP